MLPACVQLRSARARPHDFRRVYSLPVSSRQTRELVGYLWVPALLQDSVLGASSEDVRQNVGQVLC